MNRQGRGMGRGQGMQGNGRGGRGMCRRGNVTMEETAMMRPPFAGAQGKGMGQGRAQREEQ